MMNDMVGVIWNMGLLFSVMNVCLLSLNVMVIIVFLVLLDVCVLVLL